ADRARSMQTNPWNAALCLLRAQLHSLLTISVSAAFDVAAEAPLELPKPGFHQLRVLTPSLLELTLVTAKKPDPARVEQWDFVNDRAQCQLPAASEFLVIAAGKTNNVTGVGFKRRVLYAPLKHRDLRLANYLYLQLSSPLPDDLTVEVKNRSNKLWPPTMRFEAQTDQFRLSPILHVNQVGYLASQTKRAMVGYYLGNLGELDIEGSSSKKPLEFQILEAKSPKAVFSGALKSRPDRGFPFIAYQRVFEADFTPLKTPGEYRLFVSGLGTSFPFFIDDAVAGAFARTYALGIYHQRCGTANELPFTRFTHKECHVAPAEVPDTSSKFEHVNHELAQESSNFKDDPRHTAPQLKSVAASLYPFVNKGPIDVRDGHHDAGDYSKYTINSA